MHDDMFDHHSEANIVDDESKTYQNLSIINIYWNVAGSGHRHINIYP